MPAPEDYYALLGVAPEADADVIRVAYRSLMRRYHPDVSASDDAAAKAKAINEAYACLRDADKRATYDWQRTQPPIHPQTSHPRTHPQHPHRPRPVWTGPTPPREPPMQWFKPTWGNAVGLGIAALLTAITFAITSTIPPVAPAVAKHMEVRMRVVSRTGGAISLCGSKKIKGNDGDRADCPS